MTTALEQIEHTRMSMGALLDSLTDVETGSRLGQRLDELHDELAAGLALLRGDGRAKYRYRAVGCTHKPLALDSLEEVGIALDRQWTVERQVAGIWEATEEMPTAGEFA